MYQDLYHDSNTLIEHIKPFVLLNLDIQTGPLLELYNSFIPEFLGDMLWQYDHMSLFQNLFKQTRLLLVLLFCGWSQQLWFDQNLLWSRCKLLIIKHQESMFIEELSTWERLTRLTAMSTCLVPDRRFFTSFMVCV